MSKIAEPAATKTVSQVKDALFAFYTRYPDAPVEMMVNGQLYPVEAFCVCKDPDKKGKFIVVIQDEDYFKPEYNYIPNGKIPNLTREKAKSSVRKTASKIEKPPAKKASQPRKTAR